MGSLVGNEEEFLLQKVFVIAEGIFYFKEK